MLASRHLCMTIYTLSMFVTSILVGDTFMMSVDDLSVKHRKQSNCNLTKRQRSCLSAHSFSCCVYTLFWLTVRPSRPHTTSVRALMGG